MIHIHMYGKLKKRDYLLFKIKGYGKEIREDEIKIWII